jgi:hypothetical protein
MSQCIPVQQEEKKKKKKAEKKKFFLFFSEVFEIVSYKWGYFLTWTQYLYYIQELFILLTLYMYVLSFLNWLIKNITAVGTTDLVLSSLLLVVEGLWWKESGDSRPWSTSAIDQLRKLSEGMFWLGRSPCFQDESKMGFEASNLQLNDSDYRILTLS